jgi:hypothetical protein
MIIRIWRTQIDQTRAEEYRDFARSKSLPMFRAQPGFAGVLFAAHAAELAVITLLHELTGVEALEHSHSPTRPPSPTSKRPAFERARAPSNCSTSRRSS